jgi:hypothetical protein
MQRSNVVSMGRPFLECEWQCREGYQSHMGSALPLWLQESVNTTPLCI